MQPIDKAIHVLNTAYQADKASIRSIIANMVPVNKELENHPVVIVQENADGTFLTSLGLLNGVVYALTGKMLAAEWSEERDENGAHKFLGFIEYTGDDKPPMPEEYK